MVKLSLTLSLNDHYLLIPYFGVAPPLTEVGVGGEMSLQWMTNLCTPWLLIETSDVYE